MASPGRPRKTPKPIESYKAQGAEPTLYDDEGLSPADRPAEPLTEELILHTLKKYIEYGMDVKVTPRHYFLTLGKLQNSGSLLIPVRVLTEAADFLYAQHNYVNSIISSARKASRLKLGAEYSGLGEMRGKDDLAVEDVA